METSVSEAEGNGNDFCGAGAGARLFLYSLRVTILFFCRARSPAVLAFGLAHNRPADVLSLSVVVAEYSYDGRWDLKTKTCAAAKKSAARRRGEEGGRDVGAAEGVGSGVFSVELALITVLSWEQRCRRRVFVAFLCSFLER